MRSLLRLLDAINYDERRDQLGFVGDLLNRGPDSLAVLRFVRACVEPLVVLGNHDMYAIILSQALIDASTYHHTLDTLLQADDCKDLMRWLQRQPLMRTLNEQSLVLCHAGITPAWSLPSAQQYADEFNDMMSSSDAIDFCAHCFGDEPASWQASLQHHDRWRYIVNAFTRMRFCTRAGQLDFKCHEATKTAQDNYQPWYSFRSATVDGLDIVFGHWASLQQPRPAEHCFALDSGCVWGGQLTALRCEDRQMIAVPAVSNDVPA